MRSSLYHRALLLLALLASLLLAGVPTLGRLAQGVRVADAGQGTVALCTVDGLKQVAASPLAKALRAASPTHGMPMPDSAHDCDYCPLLSGMLSLAVIALWLPPQRLPAHSPPRDLAPRLAFRHPYGLGSRGPPPFSRS